jgi:hypothetical protein
MISLAHIINPAVVDKSSDLFIAQPITFETMRTAREFSGNQAEIGLYAVQFPDEPRPALPREFCRLTDLKRSVADIRTFKQRRKLPLMRDILDSLFEASQAEYLIYTNADIALQPHFYLLASRLARKGYDAFIINRRTIPDKYSRLDEIPLMLAETGEPHQGWDCFVFHRSLYPRFRLGSACIGAGWIGRVMITNLAALAKKFEIFTGLHATFHIGNRKTWQAPQWVDYLEHNRNECRIVLEEFDRTYGPFDRSQLPGRFFPLLAGQAK